MGLSGGVACYKAAELCRLLVKEGASVHVVMTDAAQKFITPVTMQALSNNPVSSSQWDGRPANNMAHINLTRAADLMVIAPCSADLLAKLAQGAADDLLSLMCLARPRSSAPALNDPETVRNVPLLLAPAMNREMWSHPATKRNLRTVSTDGALVLGVGSGDQACGETGDGRMLEPSEILEDLIAAMQPKPMAGQHVLVNAGPTYEAIDPVRGITNRSSGKMGFAIARAAREAGAAVTLVCGPVAQSTPRGVHRVDVISAVNMLQTIMEYAPLATIFIATAAVADWRPEGCADQKIKKDSSGQVPLLRFTENADILATVSALPRAAAGDLFCVGFAAESHNLLANAQAKRLRKNVPLLVGNIGPDTFGKDDNTLILVDEQGTRELARAPKLTLARQLVAEIAQRMAARRAPAKL